jgi:DMSO/TMAO reductase YedYZ molybdopterin-dependent catalytic subunit
MRGTLAGRLGRGALAGALASLALVSFSLLMRLLAGVPLIVELAGDRVIPTLDVHSFVRLLGRVGGPLHGKSLSFLLALGAEVIVGVVVGMAFAVLPVQEERDRRIPRPRASILAAAAAIATIAGAALLWPVADSNYVGLPSPWARITTILGLVLEVGVFVAVLLWAYGSLSAPARTDQPASAAAIVPRTERPDRASVEPGRGAPTLARRTVLVGGACLALAAAGGALARAAYRRATFGAFGYDGLSVRGPRTAPITPNDAFYCVTKNLIDPRVSASVWRLRVDGLVARPMTLRFDDLLALPRVEQIQTLECISNGVGGGLMSNAAWSGVTLRTLIDAAVPRPGVERVVLRGADGYVHSLSMERALDPSTIVAYAMNGRPLPDRHGYPARVLVPGTYGEVSVKWIGSIELSHTAVEGYYERQGWKPYFVQTSSRFDRPTAGSTISLARTPAVPLGGVAFAGDRGISAVEWSADGGESWVPARITYGPSKIAWSLWEATWSPSGPGTYRLVVRATDGTGAVQPSDAHGVVPAGATGVHAVSVTVTA